MSTRKPIPQEIFRAASQWLVQRSEGALPVAQEQEWQHWLAADPLHAEAYDRLTGVWSDVGNLHDLAELAPLSEPAAGTQSVRQTRPVRFAAWRRPAALAAGLVIAIAGAFIAVQMRSADVIETGLAEIREVVLPDGSTVTLGARSSVDLDFSAGERRVELQDGEAFFDVAHDVSRPFIVVAGDAHIRAVGTRFDVSRGPATVTVSVAEGKVEVSGRAAQPHTEPARMLTAGQRTEVRHASAKTPQSEAEPGAAARVTTQDPELTAAWRLGRLVYEDRRLEELVADVNRYYAPGVELATPQLGALAVTAAFRVDEIPQTLDALALALPVSAVHGPDGRIVLHSRPVAP